MIAVMLDFEESSVSFEVNGKFVGKHIQTELKDNEYVFLVILFRQDDKISIVNPEPLQVREKEAEEPQVEEQIVQESDGKKQMKKLSQLVG